MAWQVKALCYLASQSEVDPTDPYGRKGESTPTGSSLTSTLEPWHTPHTHREPNKKEYDEFMPTECFVVLGGGTKGLEYARQVLYC